MRKIVVVGASYLQVPLIKKASEMGIETHTFAWEKGAIGKEHSDYFYPISIREKDEILRICKEIRPHGIASIGSDLAMPTVNHVAEKMGLTGNSLECTELTTNKYLMRNRLRAYKLPVPKFKGISSENDFGDSFEFPFIIKPIDRSGSRGVRLVSNEKEFKEAFNLAKKESFTDMVLVEEYFDGIQFSIEMISQEGKHHFVGITEEFYTRPPYFVEEKHLMPGRIKNRELGKIIDLTKRSLSALEIENGPSHSEIRMNSKGEFCIIEIAGRMGGDFRNVLVQYSMGYDFVRDAINIAMGKIITSPKIGSKKHVIIKYIFSQNDIDQLLYIKEKYPADIISYEVLNRNLKHHVITDSSQRYGYYIIEKKHAHECLSVVKGQHN